MSVPVSSCRRRTLCTRSSSRTSRSSGRSLCMLWPVSCISSRPEDQPWRPPQPHRSNPVPGPWKTPSVNRNRLPLNSTSSFNAFTILFKKERQSTPNAYNSRSPFKSLGSFAFRRLQFCHSFFVVYTYELWRSQEPPMRNWILFWLLKRFFSFACVGYSANREICSLECDNSLNE